MTPAPIIAAVIFAGVLLIIGLLQDTDQFDGDTTVVSTNSFSAQIVAFARAIASAEGFGLEGAIPTRANNPGDLVIPKWAGQSLGAESISVLDADTYAAPLAPNGGWYRLFRQLQLIVDGNSHVYNLDMSISDMAHKWTNTEQDAWASNVATYLGVTPDVDLRSLLS